MKKEYIERLDGLEKSEIEEIIGRIPLIEFIEYTMIPEADIWKISYKGEQYKIKNDLVYGCELSTDMGSDIFELKDLMQNKEI